MPPLQISNSVAMHVSHANRLSQRVDLPEFPQFILEKITANGADFADRFLVAVALWATRHKCCSYFSAALRTAKRLQVKESAKRQVRARCAAVVRDAAKHRRLARRHLEAWAHLAAELCRVALR